MKAPTARVSLTVAAETVAWIDKAADLLGMSRSHLMADMLDAAAPMVQQVVIRSDAWPANKWDLYRDLTDWRDGADVSIERVREFFEHMDGAGSVVR